MKKTRFTEEQMVAILLEVDQRPVPEVANKHGVIAQTTYVWRKHFGSSEPTDVKRRRQVEQENQRLMRMVPPRISSSTSSSQHNLRADSWDENIPNKEFTTGEGGMLVTARTIGPS